MPARLRLVPGKLVGDDLLRFLRERARAGVQHDLTPGKLTWADVARDVDPAAALAWAQHAHVDRRAADAASELDDGALASAFSFIDRGSGGAALPPELLARLSRELGVDLSRVRVHTDDRAARAAAAIDARAFALGEHIYFAAGAYDPTSEDGIRLIAHEVAHVAQGYRGTSPTAPGVSRPGDRHEREADRFADDFVRKPAANPLRVDWAGLDAIRGTLIDALVPAVRGFVELAPPTPERQRLLDALPATAPAPAPAPAPAAPATIVAPEHAHRAPGTPGTSSPSGKGAAVLQRWQSFLADPRHERIDIQDNKRTKAAKDQARFGYLQNGYTYRYWTSSKAPFQLKDYQAVVQPKFSGVFDDDLSELYANHRATIRMSKVDHASSHRYAWTAGPTPYRDVVTDLQEKAKTEPDPDKQWGNYSQVVLYLQDTKAPKGKTKPKILLNEFPGGVNLADGQLHPLNPTAKEGDGLYQKTEADEFRHKLVQAIATHPHYEQNQHGEWKTFYDEICEAEVFQRNTGLLGNVFENVVRATLGVLDPSRPLFEDDDIGRRDKAGNLGGKRDGDGMARVNGTSLVVECKAVTKGPTAENTQQAQDYAYIVQHPVPGYIAKDGKGSDGKPLKPITFQHVVYVFPTQAIAKLWYPMLYQEFQGNTKRFSTIPSHDGKDVSVLLKANPEFTVHLDGDGPHYHLKDPPIFHPGLKMRDLDITLAEKGVPKIARGTMQADVDLGGAIQATAQQTEITPAGDAPGAVNGTITNELGKGATSKLDRLLGKVKPSIVLTDNGLKGKLVLEKGGKIVPGVVVDHGEITAGYENGQLAVTGLVHIAHQGGKFAIDLMVGWDGEAWTFNAITIVPEGLIDGLSAFVLTVEYQRGGWKISAPEATYKRKLGGVELTGKVQDLVLDPKHGEVGAQIFLTADLGPFGKAGADGVIEHGKLSRASFSYDSPELVFPKRASGKPPVFTGAVGGTLAYDSGHFHGQIRGDAALALPGLKALSDSGEVGLVVDVQVGPEGKFSGSIASKAALQFGKHFRIPSLNAKIKEDGNAEAHFEIQLSGIKNVPDAHLKAGIDQNGFHLEAAAVTIQMGDPAKDKIWGSVTASYQEGDGLTIAGEVDAKITDGMIGKGTLSYSTKKGTGDASVSVSRIPILDLDQVSKKLVDFDHQIPVFSFFGITLFLDARFTLEFLYGFKLGITPTVQINGIDLHDLSFKEAIATVEVDGDLSAALRAAPGVGLGIALLAPELVSGTVGISVPITAGAHLTPKTTLQATYDKEGGLRGGASLGLAMNFGITGALVATANVDVLMGAWKPSWSQELGGFTIMQPRELFNWTLDLGQPIKKHDPQLPDGGPAPMATKPKGTTTIESTPRSGAPPKQTGTPSNSGTDNGNAGVSQLLPQLKQIPQYQTLDSILHEAIELWEKFSHVVSAIKDAVKSGAIAIKNAACWAGTEVWEGISWAGGKIAWVGDKIGDAAAGAYHLAGDAVDDIGDYGGSIIDGIGDLL